MSGHSHYATIKRQKAVKDDVKGKIFSRHAKAIAIAIKAGGGADPEMNSKLRFAIEQAKADNMPKVNIERILSRAEEVQNIEEVTYEGYGPEGIAVVVEVATDNRNRTAQEIKNIFERGGGRLAGPGSVSYNFAPMGLIVLRKSGNGDEQILKIIDLGVEDVTQEEEEVVIYTLPDKLNTIKEAVSKEGYVIVSFALIKKAKNSITAESEEKLKKILHFLNTLEEHDDVQNVFSNLDILPSS